jgi:hypothetical protein
MRVELNRAIAQTYALKYRIANFQPLFLLACLLLTQFAGGVERRERFCQVFSSSEYWPFGAQRRSCSL